MALTLLAAPAAVRPLVEPAAAAADAVVVGDVVPVDGEFMGRSSSNVDERLGKRALAERRNCSFCWIICCVVRPDDSSDEVDCCNCSGSVGDCGDCAFEFEFEYEVCG